MILKVPSNPWFYETATYLIHVMIQNWDKEVTNTGVRQYLLGVIFAHSKHSVQHAAGQPQMISYEKGEWQSNTSPSVYTCVRTCVFR